MGAYGAKVGRKYSDLEHRDYQECITGDKQKKRAIFLLFFAVPISSADDVFYHPPHLFRIVHILKRAEAIAAQRKKLFLEGKLDSTFLDNHQEQGQRCNAKEKRIERASGMERAEDGVECAGDGVESARIGIFCGKMFGIYPPSVKMRFSNLGSRSKSFIVPREQLTIREAKILEETSSGYVLHDNGVDASSQTAPEVLPLRRQNTTQTEVDPRMEACLAIGEIMHQMTTVSVAKPAGTHAQRSLQMLHNLFSSLDYLRNQLGTYARLTVFTNVNKLAASMLGVAESSIARIKNKVLPEPKKKMVESRKLRHSQALKLLTEDQQQLIRDHIARCYEDESNFSLESLHEDLQNEYCYPFSTSTLYRQLRALRFSNKISSWNPFCSVRKDIIEWRNRYLVLISQKRLEGAFITYYDETWLFNGMSKIRGWNPTDTNPYLISHLGNLNQPRPGFVAGSDKGRRAIVLAVTTESNILPGSVDVIISDRPPEEALVDYHACMNADMFKKYMEKVLPLIAQAAPQGRQPVLVIDNASVHNRTIEKVIPTKSSRKQDLRDFLEKYGLDIPDRATNDNLWALAETVIESQGGRRALKRYEIDEYAATLGVQIIRLPPYHCQFSPIELIWNQLKTHLRSFGKSTDSLEAVRTRAMEYLKNKSEADLVWTYEHVIEIEEGIKLIIDQEAEEAEGEDEEDEMAD